MKVTCDRRVLADALATACRTTAARPGIVTLGGALLEMDVRGVLQITTNDLDVQSTVALPAVGEPGRTLVPARLLSEIVRAADGDEITLSATDTTLDLRATGLRISLRTLPPDDFPRMPSQVTPETLILPSAVLTDGLAQVLVAASRDAMRPVLNAVLIEQRGHEIVIVSTDDHRLCRRTMPADDAHPLRMLVPLKAAQELTRFPFGPHVRIELEGGTARFGDDSASLVVRLTEGRFPDYDTIVDVRYPNRLAVDRQQLIDAIKLLGLLGGDSPIVLGLNGEGAHVTCEASGVGSGQRDPIGKYEGTSMTISLNHDFLLDGLQTIRSDAAIIDVADDALRLAIHDDSRVRYVLTAMRKPKTD